MGRVLITWLGKLMPYLADGKLLIPLFGVLAGAALMYAYGVEAPRDEEQGYFKEDTVNK